MVLEDRAEEQPLLAVERGREEETRVGGKGETRSRGDVDSFAAESLDLVLARAQVCDLPQL